MATDGLCLNERAVRVADHIASRADELGVCVSTVGPARVIDAGVNAAGGIGAGLLVARACVADLARVDAVPGRVGDVSLPAITVHTAQPVAACMASQYAGWPVSVGDYFAMGSGPMRAAVGKEELFSDIGWTESPPCALGVLESARVPGEDVVRHIADACGVGPEHLTLIAARTASIAGGVQVVARSVETALHKLYEIGFDLRRVVAAFGVAPLPPVARDDIAAIGRTNDAVLYGAEVTLVVAGAEDTLVEAGERLPSAASKDYGEAFADLFERYDHDFYKIDPMLFSPAAVCLQSLESGRAHSFGGTNQDLLVRSFFGD